jgi:hypothetical protein
MEARIYYSWKRAHEAEVEQLAASAYSSNSQQRIATCRVADSGDHGIRVFPPK